MPIPTEDFVCTRGCCTRSFVPLTIAYARTIHKFQGMSAGPVDPGKIKNMYDVIVCDPDDKEFEGTALGLLYTGVSRATTLGDNEGRGSAIYFTGSSLREDRIRNLTMKKDGKKEFEMAKKRRYWVNYISARAQRFKAHVKEIMTKKELLLRWATTQTYSYDELYNRINNYQTR